MKQKISRKKKSSKNTECRKYQN